MKKLFLAGALLLAGCGDPPACKFELGSQALLKGEVVRIVGRIGYRSEGYGHTRCTYSITFGDAATGQVLTIHHVNEYMLGDMNENSNQAKPVR